MTAAVRDVQEGLIAHYSAKIRGTTKADAGDLDLDEDDENRDFIADAYRTTPDCTALAAGSDSAATGVVTTWTIIGAGDPRTIQVVSSYRVPGRLRADTLTTQIRCLP